MPYFFISDEEILIPLSVKLCPGLFFVHLLKQQFNIFSINPLCYFPVMVN
ncbi:Uncharacterised protein [Serratia plymuthica]|nr:Uncharacterised protein [Serratia plymuthica]